MDGKHSPGPWRVLTGGLVWTDQPGVFGMKATRNHGDIGHPICEVTQHRTTLGSFFDHDDARLIAAAPELLEALRALCDTYLAYRHARPVESLSDTRAEAADATYNRARAILGRIDEAEPLFEEV